MGTHHRGVPARREETRVETEEIAETGTDERREDDIFGRGMEAHHRFGVEAMMSGDGRQVLPTFPPVDDPDIQRSARAPARLGPRPGFQQTPAEGLRIGDERVEGHEEAVHTRLEVSHTCPVAHLPGQLPDALLSRQRQRPFRIQQHRRAAARGHAGRIQGYDPGAHPAAPIVARGWPAATSSPLVAWIAVTTPSHGAVTGVKTFIASMMKSVCPVTIAEPSRTKGALSGSAA
jgi:hypothetical protein